MDQHPETPSGRRAYARHEGVMPTIRRLRLVVVTLHLLSVSAVLSAHHSFTAAFDAQAPVLITGVVTRVVWANPHVMFSIDETGADDTVTTWRLELGAPSVLLQRGWARTSLAIGDTVTVDGLGARDGSYNARVTSVTLKSGHTLFAGDGTTRGSPR